MLIDEININIADNLMTVWFEYTSHYKLWDIISKKGGDKKGAIDWELEENKPYECTGCFVCGPGVSRCRKCSINWLPSSMCTDSGSLFSIWATHLQNGNVEKQKEFARQIRDLPWNFSKILK